MCGDALYSARHDERGESEEELDQVQLMTLHCVERLLEFPNMVYMVGMEEGFLPHQSRRIDYMTTLMRSGGRAYVGITAPRRN